MYYMNISGHMQSLNISYNSEEKRLDIDSVQPDLKVVMLQNGNIWALIPFGLAVHMKKSHNNMIQLQVWST